MESDIGSTATRLRIVPSPSVGLGAVYVEIPKVACTSIKVLLAKLIGIDLVAVDGDPHAANFPEPPEPPRSKAPLYPGLFTFAFVRNPWDRLVSCYRDKIAGEVDGFTYFTIRPGVANCLARFEAFEAGMSFEGFVNAVASIPDKEADEHFRSQYTFVTDADAQIGIEFIGRFERLADDFEEVRRRTGLPAVELPRLQASRTRVSYASYYTQATCDIVRERFRTDIELFGYDDFEEL